MDLIWAVFRYTKHAVNNNLERNGGAVMVSPGWLQFQN